jgi:glycosyltransferase involved in cell wall biosynthesis
VVIPAYNEADNLKRVLTAASRYRWLTQIVVADDGSTDGTSAVVKSCQHFDERIQVVSLPANQGKAAAMLAGVQALQSDLVIFLDADLLDLRPEHIRDLQAPVVDGQAEMSIALFRRGRWRTNISHRLTPNLSGQRCLGRDEAERILLPAVGTRFGVEMALTRFAKTHDWRIQRVYWTGVSHLTKEEKRKGLSRFSARWEMYREIAGVLA